MGRAFHKSLSQPGYAFKASIKRARSFLSYKFSEGRSAFPETVSILLTYQCNLRCKMCGQWGEAGASKHFASDILKQHLNIADLKKLVDDVSFFKPTITLFGGEPLIYKGWDEIVTHIKSKGMRCNIITNGTLLETNSERIVSLGLDEIILSLDGPAIIHDQIRGRKGTFQSLEKGVQKINNLKLQSRKKRPLFNVNSTIFDFNYKKMEEVIDVAITLKAKTITFHHLIFINEQTYDHHNKIFKKMFGIESTDWAGFIDSQLPNIDIDFLIAEIKRIKANRHKIPVSFYPNLSEDEIRKYYTNFDFESSSYPNRCLSPWMVAYIFPDGTVRPCLSMNYSVGNINHGQFQEIWNNDNYQTYRNVLKQRKCFPVCKRCTEFYRF